MTRRLFSFIFFVFCTFSSIKVFAQNYEIDIPEGFDLIDTDDDGKGFMFFSSSALTYCVIRESSEYKSAQQALSSSIEKLKARASVKNIFWDYKNCAITKSFSIVMNNAAKTGRAAAIPMNGTKDILIVICFGEKTALSEAICDSIVDSISVDRGGKFCAGIVTSLLYPKGEEKEIALEIEGKKINTAIDENAEKAEQYVIDREFEIMKSFVSSPRWKEAWIRYYQQLYRVAYFYLQRSAFDIATALYENDTQFAKSILSWVQYFDYEHEETGSDYTGATRAIQTKKNDCDSRSVILAAILNQAAIPSTIFVSREYAHMIAGVNLKDAGFKMQGATSDFYLTAETTSRGLSLGKMLAETADRSKWIDVNLPR